MVAEKRCNRCSLVKPINEFDKDKSKKDGFRAICKECRVELRRKYYKEHKDEVLKKMREYYDKHKEGKLKYSEEYYEKHKEQILKKKKEYREKHRDEIAKKKQEYCERHKEEIAKKKKEYSKTLTGKLVRAHVKHKRRLLSKEAESTLTVEQWQKILDMQDNKCNLCGKRFTTKRKETIDHIIPLSEGGGLTFENVQALCASCNSRKQNKLLPNFIQTWTALDLSNQKLLIERG